jgi:mannose-6-phosphate isomerase class I
VERGTHPRPHRAQHETARVSYDPEPRYPVVGGEVQAGWEALAADVARRRPRVLAVDGPAALPWEEFGASLGSALLQAAGARIRTLDVRSSLAPWDEIQRRTAAAELAGDPVFARTFEGSLSELFDGLPSARTAAEDITLVLGPGSALVDHDVLWYADLPKRLALDAVQRGRAGNVGQAPGEPGSERRLLFVDWPMLDRHKQELAGNLDRYIDLSDPDAPRSVEGDVLRRSLAALAVRPFRTRPTFLPGPWGGQWLRGVLGVATDAPNLAWSYELITPESGILLGDAEPAEVGFELLMSEHAPRVLGAEVAERFGQSFPIRFDYLDTLDGGHLSIQCHPSETYMRETFGLPYTQHETYYVMVTTPGAKIFLGLREDADLDAFRAETEQAEDPGHPFEPERYLETHPAAQHRLYLIPAGTPHASGAGNVVLEISATPYLYTLRFYDWLRRDLDAELRPVHLRHAFSNLDPCRRGEAVRRELIPEPVIVRQGPGWAELALSRLPELFFAVHRLDFADEIADNTCGRFHTLNLVAGEQVEIVTAAGHVHPLSYAETIVIPAAVGAYRIRRRRGESCKVVKAFVR